MKKLVLFLTTIFVISCTENPESHLEHLNGYWEIDEVTLPDGSKRDYGYNDTIDYIEITDSLIGFRKKLKPNFDGTFSASENIETLKIVVENDSLNLYYKTPFAEWKETVLEVNESKLIIQNQNKIQYVYKRYEPIFLE